MSENQIFTADVHSIGISARTIPFNSWKSARITNTRHLKSTASAHLRAIMDTGNVSMPRNWNMSGGPVGWLMGYRYVKAQVQPQFAELIGAIGLDKSSNQAAFITAFDEAYGSPSELRDIKRLEGAIRAGLSAAAGGEHKLNDLIERTYPTPSRANPDDLTRLREANPNDDPEEIARKSIRESRQRDGARDSDATRLLDRVNACYGELVHGRPMQHTTQEEKARLRAAGKTGLDVEYKPCP